MGTKMNSFFDLLKHDRTLNFQKKLVKKLTQLIFPKIDKKKSCMSTIVIINNHFEVDPSLLT